MPLVHRRSHITLDTTFLRGYMRHLLLALEKSLPRSLLEARPGFIISERFGLDTRTLGPKAHPPPRGAPSRVVFRQETFQRFRGQGLL